MFCWACLSYSQIKIDFWEMDIQAQTQDDLLRGIVNWSGAAWFVDKICWTDLINSFCKHFFFIQKINFWKKLYKKDCNFKPCCILIKSVLLRRELKIEISFLLMVSFSIPLDKLPCTNLKWWEGPRLWLGNDASRVQSGKSLSRPF